MRRSALVAAACLLSGLLPPPAGAQPTDLPIPAATTGEYPPGVKVAKSPSGPIYVDAQGRTLYGMDMRTLLRWSPDPAQYCQNACAQQWEPLLAAGKATNIAFPRGNRESPREGFVQPQKAPDWTVVSGPQGPQWVYKGWHVVFVRKGDKPGSTAFDGADDFTWNTLKFVPAAPKPAAPGNVSVVFADGAYVLADDKGRVLFTGTCKGDCSRWKPLGAGLASRGFGEWSVGRAGDAPQWLYRGKPVYVSQEDDPIQPPKGGAVLRP